MIRTELETLVDSFLTDLGYELWCLEIRTHLQTTRLQLSIDKPGGVTIGDCELVGKGLGRLLNVDMPTNKRYQLEVSSPGVPRPLFKPSQYEKYVGRSIQLTLKDRLDGSKKIIGVLESVTDSQVAVRGEASLLAIAFSQIAKAHLIEK